RARGGGACPRRDGRPIGPRLAGGARSSPSPLRGGLSGRLRRALRPASLSRPAPPAGMTETPSLAGHVAAALLPFRVDGLISPEARQGFASSAGLLPAAASGFFGFECRLADPEPVADFLARISPTSGGRE